MPSGPYGVITPGDLIGLLSDPGVQNAIRAIVPAGWTLPSTSALGDTPKAGGFGAWAQADHVHGRESLASIVPVGTIADFGNGVPAGWLACDGSAVPRTGATAALFAYLGTTWGAGDGVTTFNLPDARGASRIGAGQGTYVGATNHILGVVNGEETHTLTTAEMPSHAHTYPNTASAGGGPNIVEGAPNAGTGSNMNNTGGGGAHNTYHPYAVVTTAIKT